MFWDEIRGIEQLFLCGTMRTFVSQKIPYKGEKTVVHQHLSSQRVVFDERSDEIRYVVLSSRYGNWKRSRAK